MIPTSKVRARRGPSRIGTLAITLVVSLAFLAAVRSAWTRAAAPVDRERSPEDWVLLSPPAQECEVHHRRTRTKTQVVDRLLAGEFTLAEAAACFRFLDDNPPEYPADFRSRYPGDSEGERACRQVIAWVATRLRTPGHGSKGAGVFRRLEAELQALLAEPGGVELPW